MCISLWAMVAETVSYTKSTEKLMSSAKFYRPIRGNALYKRHNYSTFAEDSERIMNFFFINFSIFMFESFLLGFFPIKITPSRANYHWNCIFLIHLYDVLQLSNYCNRCARKVIQGSLTPNSTSNYPDFMYDYSVNIHQ